MTIHQPMATLRRIPRPAAEAPHRDLSLDKGRIRSEDVVIKERYHLETDAEYIARLKAAGRAPVHCTFAGLALDVHGNDHGMSRRIVESSAD